MSPPLPPPERQSRRVIWLLCLVSLVGYALRSNITIAQEYMAPDLGLSMTDMGAITAWGFQLSYALFQLPGGFLGDRYGARLILFLAVVGWSVASFATGAVPVAGVAVAFAWLFAARVLLGAAQAATYPVSAMAAVQYIPAGQRVGASALYLAAGSLGSALAPLTLAPLMARAGWRAVFLASTAVGLLTALVWIALVPRRTERAGTLAYVPLGAQLRASLRLLRHRPLLVLSTSYLLHSATYFVFVFWFFRYLIDGRGFSLLESGMWGSVPYLFSFALAPAVGVGADRLARRIPAGLARRRTAMACLCAAAALVVLGANAPGPALAISALGLSVALLVSCEAPFWTTATALAETDAGTAGGVLNLMGNLGGVLSIWLVPIMKEHWGWTLTLGFWAGVAVLAALLWTQVEVPAH